MLVAARCVVAASFERWQYNSATLPEALLVTTAPATI